MAKTKKAFALSAVFVGLLCFSCGNFSDISLPESVAVKTNASFVAALGQKYYDLSEKLGSDFINDLSVNVGASVYKYIPDPSDETLQYLLHKNVYEVPLDVGEYIKRMDLDDTLGDGFAFEKEIALPEVNKNVVIPVLAGATGTVPFSVSIEIAMDSAITDATIKSGSISIKAAGQGAILDFETFTLEGITKPGGGKYEKGDFKDSEETGNWLINKTLDLGGGKLEAKATEIKADGSVYVKSGTISDASSLVCAVAVQSLSEATAKLSDVASFVMNETSENKQQVPAELAAYVKSMDFGVKDGNYYYKSDASGTKTQNKGQGKGIKFTAVNSFPEGNDIALVIKSTTFGIDSSAGIYSNGELKESAAIPAKGSAAPFEQSFASFDKIEVTADNFGTKDEPKYIQFEISLSGEQQFKDLEMGATYKIAVSDSAMLFDWDKAVIALSNVEPVQSDQDLSDFSIDSMMGELDGEISKLVENCDFVTVPIYFLVQKPTGSLAADIGDLSLKGKVYFSYTDSASAPKIEYAAGSETTTAELSVCPSVEWPAMGSVVAKAFSEKGTDYSFFYDAANLLNQRPENLKVNYSMEIDGGKTCSFYKARLDSLSPDEKTSIAVEMAAVIPLTLKVNKDTELDIYEIAEMDVEDKTDLMSRSDVSKTENAAKYCDAISYFRLNYNFINAAIDGFDATITIDDRHEGEADAADYSGIFREIAVTGNDSSDDVIEFSKDEIKDALTHFFMPKMTMTIPVETFSVKRAAVESPSSVGISPVLRLQLDDNTPIVITDIIK